MNYLAHLFLSDDSPEALLGALLGDFVKGADKNSYPPEVRRSIELHRQIDSYTDSHAIVLAAKRQFALERRRFAGIALDIFYDHCLAKNWAQFSAIPLRTFTNNVYDLLQTQREFLPAKMQEMASVMVAQDWLASYAELDWIELTLERMAKRLTRGAPLAESILDLRTNYQVLEESFLQLFPEMISHFERGTNLPEND